MKDPSLEEFAIPFCILCEKNEREKERETVSIPKDNGNGKVGVWRIVWLFISRSLFDDRMISNIPKIPWFPRT